MKLQVVKCTEKFVRMFLGNFYHKLFDCFVEINFVMFGNFFRAHSVLKLSFSLIPEFTSSSVIERSTELYLA